MHRFIYTIIYYLLLPVIYIRLLWRSIKAPSYRNRIAERFGLFTLPTRNKAEGTEATSIWIHCVSVGETIAALPLIKKLQQSYPHGQFTVTTTTPTGSDQVKKHLGDSVFHVYAPYDVPSVVNRFIKKIQPDIAIIMETELWPNTIYCCKKKNIPVVVANARLSEKSAKGYQRFSQLTRQMLQNITIIAVQTKIDGDRFLALGLPKKALTVTGSIKFDIEIDEKQKQKSDELTRQWQIKNRPVWIGASTHQGEDEILLEAHKKLLSRDPNTLLLLVPRHPERFQPMFELATAQGFETQKCSELSGAVNPQTQVLLGDCMGELMTWFGVVNAAFVGGSLVNNGGHNVLEPAVWGLPIVTGKSLFNFADIAEHLIKHEALMLANNSNDLAESVKGWLENPGLAQQMGKNAQQVVQRNQGALEKTATLIEPLISH